MDQSLMSVDTRKSSEGKFNISESASTVYYSQIDTTAKDNSLLDLKIKSPDEANFPLELNENLTDYQFISKDKDMSILTSMDSSKIIENNNNDENNNYLNTPKKQQVTPQLFFSAKHTKIASHQSKYELGPDKGLDLYIFGLNSEEIEILIEIIENGLSSAFKNKNNHQTSKVFNSTSTFDDSGKKFDSKSNMCVLCTRQKKINKDLKEKIEEQHHTYLKLQKDFEEIINGQKKEISFLVASKSINSDDNVNIQKREEQANKISYQRQQIINMEKENDDLKYEQTKENIKIKEYEGKFLLLKVELEKTKQNVQDLKIKLNAGELNISQNQDKEIKMQEDFRKKDIEIERLKKELNKRVEGLDRTLQPNELKKFSSKEMINDIKRNRSKELKPPTGKKDIKPAIISDASGKNSPLVKSASNSMVIHKSVVDSDFQNCSEMQRKIFDSNFLDSTNSKLTNTSPISSPNGSQILSKYPKLKNDFKKLQGDYEKAQEIINKLNESQSDQINGQLQKLIHTFIQKISDKESDFLKKTDKINNKIIKFHEMIQKIKQIKEHSAKTSIALSMLNESTVDHSAKCDKEAIKSLDLLECKLRKKKLKIKILKDNLKEQTIKKFNEFDVKIRDVFQNVTDQGIEIRILKEKFKEKSSSDWEKILNLSNSMRIKSPQQIIQKEEIKEVNAFEPENNQELGMEDLFENHIKKELYVVENEKLKEEQKASEAIMEYLWGLNEDTIKEIFKFIHRNRELQNKISHKRSLSVSSFQTPARSETFSTNMHRESIDAYSEEIQHYAYNEDQLSWINDELKKTNEEFLLFQEQLTKIAHEKFNLISQIKLKDGFIVKVLDQVQVLNKKFTELKDNVVRYETKNGEISKSSANTDQKTIITDLDDRIATLEQENNSLRNQIEQLNKKQAILHSNNYKARKTNDRSPLTIDQSIVFESPEPNEPIFRIHRRGMSSPNFAINLKSMIIPRSIKEDSIDEIPPDGKNSKWEFEIIR